MSALATIRRHAEAHRALAIADAYSAQEAPRLESALTAITELTGDDATLALEQAAAMLRYGLVAVKQAERRRIADTLDGLAKLARTVAGDA